MTSRQAGKTRIKNPKRLLLARAFWASYTLLYLLIISINLVVYTYNLQNSPEQVVEIGHRCNPEQGCPILRIFPLGRDAGLQNADFVVAIDGIPAQAARLETGNWEIGETHVFTVVDEKGITQDVPILLKGSFLISQFADLGFHKEWAIGFLVGVEVLFNLIFLSIALILLRFRSDDWLALLAAAVMSSVGLNYFNALYFGIFTYPQVAAFFLILRDFSASLTLLILLLLPDGRFQSFWSWSLVIVHLFLFVGLRELLGLLPQSLYTILWGGIPFLGLGLMVYRYIWVLEGVKRQQMKWILVATLFVLTGSAVVGSLGVNTGIIRLIIPGIGLTIAWLAIVFSILRYRLWDIDIVINRSIVGILVTTLLLLIFVPSVFLIQNLLGAENTLLSYAVSAAIPALLFNPTRKRVRNFVDRRVYGFNFDINQLRAAQKKAEIKNAGALTGKKLGQYEVLDFIGKGGMGEVYKGYADGKTVALKTMLEQFAKEESFMRRFQREMEVMQSLEHPKIVKLYGAGESEGLHYLAMEFVEGIELKEYLRDKGKISLEDAKEILCDIAEALDYLHSKGIVHRDIKPSNVMLRGDDPMEAILMDFGIAKIEDGKTRLTGSGAIGTIDYMSPEQILAAKTVDGRSDVYALGVIAYEMLTGKRPFEGNAAQVMFAHLQKPVTDPRQHRSDLPETLSHAILKALEKQPEDRFESAGAFVGALG